MTGHVFALYQTRIMSFVLRTALRGAAASIRIEQFERVTLSDRDTNRILEFLENPPAPNAKLLAAARGLPTLR